MTTRKPTLALDFDGTCVTHGCPEIGIGIGAAVWLRLICTRVNIILYTIRGNRKESPDIAHKELLDAIGWFQANGIDLWAVNENPDQASNFPDTVSPKVLADLYLDDRAFGVPLKTTSASRYPFVDWAKVGPALAAWAGVPTDEYEAKPALATPDELIRQSGLATIE